MSQFSNYEAIADTLADLGDCQNFTDGTGKAILDSLADKIYQRSQAESGASGNWDANVGRYGEKKRAAGIPVGKGLKPSTTRMLDLKQITGRREITIDSITMTHGEDDDQNRKAQWFTSGSEASEDSERSGAINQPARPFYEMTEDDASESVDLVGEAIEHFIRSL